MNRSQGSADSQARPDSHLPYAPRVTGEKLTALRDGHVLVFLNRPRFPLVVMWLARPWPLRAVTHDG